MKILSVDQIRKLDASTITNEPISSLDLMERAAHTFSWWFCNQFQNKQPVIIFCGKGNNGGDGLAVARILSQKSFSVQVFIVEHSTNASADFSMNLERLQGHLNPQVIKNQNDIPTLKKDWLCIDALLGSGMSRPTEGILADVISHINQSSNITISVDIASGLFADRSNDKNDIIIEPHFTISFHLPKLAFMLPQNAKHVGEWRWLDIGLDPNFITKAETNNYYSDAEVIEGIVKVRDKYSHKGTFGHALIIAGSYGKMGAAVLSGQACLRSGVGLLTMHVPECGYQIVQISIPEAMATVDINTNYNTQFPDISTYSAIGLGPGLGQDPETVEMFRALLSSVKTPLVIDADALNILSQNPDLLACIPARSILTPHPKEFQRLVGDSKNEYERLEKGREFAKKHQVIICLKGANTAVILPNGNIHFNSTGNPGMATGGTGDVLTGIITGLLAQGYEPEKAAILSVYEHGLAGDRAASKKGQSALIASDVIENLGW